MSFALRAVATLSTTEIFGPEARLEQEARDGFNEDSARCPDEMHIHLFRDEDLPAKQELVVQRTRRHEPTHDPQPARNFIQPVQVEFCLYAGDDITARRSQVIELGAIRCGQEQHELVVVEWRRRSVSAVILLQEPDGKWRRLFGFVSLSEGQPYGWYDGRNTRLRGLLIPPPFLEPVISSKSAIEKQCRNSRGWMLLPAEGRAAVKPALYSAGWWYAANAGDRSPWGESDWLQVSDTEAPCRITAPFYWESKAGH